MQRNDSTPAANLRHRSHRLGKQRDASHSTMAGNVVCSSHTAQARLFSSSEERLVYLKQINHAVRWLHALIQEVDALRPGLQKVFRYRPNDPWVLIQTDACPTGMGAYLMIAGKFAAYWHDSVTAADLELLGATAGDPAFQSEWELLAVWISVETFMPILSELGCNPRILLRTDNAATISAAMDYRAKSPLMVQLAAEISMQMEVHQLSQLRAEHVLGISNKIADQLSRMQTHDSVPGPLRTAKCLVPQPRGKHMFRAWP